MFRILLMMFVGLCVFVGWMKMFVGNLYVSVLVLWLFVLLMGVMDVCVL